VVPVMPISLAAQGSGRRPISILIDAPPLLHVGDALTLSSKVDAMIPSDV